MSVSVNEITTYIVEIATPGPQGPPGIATILNAQFTAAADQTVFMLPVLPLVVVFLFSNGSCYYPNTDFTVSGASITLEVPANEGDRIMVVYSA